MENRAQIFIYSYSRVLYSSYYILGLYEVYGKCNVSFIGGGGKFQALCRDESHSFDHYMAYVIKRGDSLQKVIIDFRDKPSIKESAYNWCDKYAKINFNRKLTDPRFHNKIISIPPGFGIRIWNLWQTAWYCGTNLIRCRFNPITGLKGHVTDYYAQYSRPKIGSYQPKKSIDDYVFFISRLWQQQNCIEKTNLIRKSFIEACQALPGLHFEGGLFTRRILLGEEKKQYQHLIFSKFYRVKNYVNKTRISAISFNTPAVHNCHGWKLGEYLAMGKAIISTPLSNELPYPLEDGHNVIYVQNTEQIGETISMILTNPLLRHSLEEGARNYYQKYAAPKSVIQMIEHQL